MAHPTRLQLKGLGTHHTPLPLYTQLHIRLHAHIHTHMIQSAQMELRSRAEEEQPAPRLHHEGSESLTGVCSLLQP